jgi:putative acetyltransferase
MSTSIPYRIRPFTPADQAAARAVILLGLSEHFGLVDSTFNPDLDDITASYLAPGHVFLVAESSGNLVGTGALRIGKGPGGQIVRVSVARHLRRLGIGQALVTALLEVAQARGIVRVWMETNDDWHDAIRLYQRCGFQAFDHRQGCVYMKLGVSLK